MGKDIRKLAKAILPWVVVVIFAVGMGVAVDEYVASQSSYRITVWDRFVGRDEVPQGRAEVSQQLAIQICRQKAASEFGRNLLMSKFDQRSSRYNKELKVYTVFVNLTIKNKEREAIYIRCDISAVNRMILESRVKGFQGFSVFGS